MVSVVAFLALAAIDNLLHVSPRSLISTRVIKWRRHCIFGVVFRDFRLQRISELFIIQKLSAHRIEVKHARHLMTRVEMRLRGLT